MALQKQNAVFPLAKGVDTKTDPKQLVAGTMEVLENAIFVSPGQFKKRNGYQALASISNPKGLGVLNDELVAFGNNSVYSYSPGDGSFVSSKISPTTPTAIDFQGMQLKTYRALANYDDNAECCSAYHSNGLQAFVVNGTSQNSYFTIIDYNTNATLLDPIVFVSSAIIASKVYTIGNYFIIFYFQGTSVKYIAVPVNKTSGSLAAAVTIASNLPASGQTIDACVNNNILYMAWGLSSTGVGVAKLDTSLTLIATAIPLPDTISKAVSITPDATLSRLSISYFSGSAVKYLQSDFLFNTLSPSTLVETINNVITIVSIINNNAGYIYYEIAVSGLDAGAFYNNYIKRSTITAGVAGSVAVWVRSVGINSKPFVALANGSNVTCIMVGYNGHQPALGQGTDFILNTSAVVIGKLAPGNCFGVTSKNSASVMSNPVEVNAISTSLFTSSFLRADFGYAYLGAQYSTYGAYGVTFDFDDIESYQNATAANNLHVVGGILGMYDGQNFVEHGFNIIAEPVTSATASYDMMTTNFDTGDYSYQIVFEWIDAQGNFHQGVPSSVFTVSITGPQTQIALVVPTLRLTQKDKVFLSVYRNTLAAPTVFNRIVSTVTSTQLNDPTAASITVNDIYPDSTVESQQLIYTTGGVVPDYSVPSPKLVVGYRNRLAVLPSETPNILWISKNIVQGIPAIPVEFSAFFTIQVNTLGGDITAFSQMDEKGVIFKKNSIFYFVGDGPTDTGSSNDISIPQQIPTDSGTANQRSILLMHDGIMYQSENNGIYLLDRSLNVSYIGAPVEAYNGSIVLSSKILPNSTQVRFLLDSGVALVYDYYAKQWSVFTNHSGVDAVIYDTNYTYLSSGGVALEETEGEYSDNGSFITMRLKTGWLSFAGIQGFQRVWKMLMLGEYKSSHQLLVSIAYDFNPNVFQTVQFNPADIFDNPLYGADATYGDSTPYGGTYPLEQFTIYPIIQRCEAMQVTIEDVENDVVGESYAISSLAFEIGVEGGLQRQAATRKFG